MRQMCNAAFHIPLRAHFVGHQVAQKRGLISLRRDILPCVRAILFGPVGQHLAQRQDRLRRYQVQTQLSDIMLVAFWRGPSGLHPLAEVAVFFGARAGIFAFE
jgi:hypothetical protein